MRLAHASPHASILIDCVRFWRRARDLGGPVQPVLAAAFSNRAGGGFLAPAIDGLLTLFEAAFRRRFEAGDACDDELTRDEERLLELLEHDDQPAPAGVRPALFGSCARRCAPPRSCFASRCRAAPRRAELRKTRSLPRSEGARSTSSRVFRGKRVIPRS